MRLTASLLVALLATMSCAGPRYVYAPTRTTGAVIAGASTTSYVLSPDGPQGTVGVALLGVGTKQLAEGSQGRGASKWRGIHIALEVVNSSDETWKVDPAEQRVELPGEDEPRIAYATSANSAVITIAPRTTRHVDLQFLLPTGLEHPRQLPALNVIWVVRAGTHVVTRRTTFERFVASPSLDRLPAVAAPPR